MKRLIRTIFAALLAAFARKVLKKYRPTIVMVTGSVGKTSTKDAVAAALSRSLYVRASEKSYNSEFGVPLTILGVKNPWRSIPGWVHVYGEAIALLIFPNAYPKVLILEVGADSPGDLARILRIATPDVVVLTRLPDMPVHVEAYATPDAVREEEFQPAYALSPGAPLILSADDPFACTLAAPLSVRTITFGQSEQADVRLGTPALMLEHDEPVGMEATVTLPDGTSHTLSVRGAVGAPQLLAPAAAFAAALTLNLKPKDVLKNLESYIPPPGRGRILRGKNNTVLIDDSYNASPAAVEEALQSLNLVHTRLKKGRRIAVLGDMLELGRYSQEAHEKIGRSVAERADVLYTVGPRARAIAEAALKAGMAEDRIHSFDSSPDAALGLGTDLKEHDIILIKGSQSMRTEKVTEALLMHETDRKLLVRQDREWKKR